MPCPERRERRRPGHRSRTPRCGRWRGRRSVRTASTWMPVTPPLGPSLRRPPAGGEQPRRHRGVPPVDLDHGEGRQEDGGGAHGAQHSASVQPDFRAVARHPTRHVGARVTVMVPVRSNRPTVRPTVRPAARPAARPAPRPAPGGTAADTKARTSTDPRATEWKIQGHPHVWVRAPPSRTPPAPPAPVTAPHIPSASPRPGSEGNRAKAGASEGRGERRCGESLDGTRGDQHARPVTRCGCRIPRRASDVHGTQTRLDRCPPARPGAGGHCPSLSTPAHSFQGRYDRLPVPRGHRGPCNSCCHSASLSRSRPWRRWRR